MSEITKFQLEIYANQMLIDYDSVNPGTIFKDKIKISHEDAWRVQSAVADLRRERGEEVAGYKIGCISEKTRSIWASPNQHRIGFGRINYMPMLLS